MDNEQWKVYGDVRIVMISGQRAVRMERQVAQRHCASGEYIAVHGTPWAKEVLFCVATENGVFCQWFVAFWTA